MNQRDDELQAIEQFKQAFKNYMRAFLLQFSQFRTGVLSEEIMDHLTLVESKLRAAEAKMVRLANV